MKDNYDPRAYFENTSKEERDAIFQSYIQKKNTRPTNTGVIMPVIFFVFAAIMLGFACFGGVSQMLKERACTQTVIGTVTEEAKGKMTSAKHTDSSVPFQDVRYSYTADGKNYTVIERIFLNKEPEKEVGATYPLKVDPNDPRQVCFPGKDESGGAKALYVSFGLGSLLVGAVLLLSHRFRNS